MAQKALTTTNELLYAGTGGTAVEAAVTKINDNFTELYNVREVCLALTPNSVTTAYLPAPSGMRVKTVEFKRGDTAFATGTFVASLALVGGAGTAQLNSATYDVSAVTASYVAATLAAEGTRTAGAGKVMALTLTSNNGAATGGPLCARVTYESAS